MRNQAAAACIKGQNSSETETQNTNAPFKLMTDRDGEYEQTNT